MAEQCERPIFGPGKGFTVVGHCVLEKNHQGKCSTKVRVENPRGDLHDPEQQLDFNLSNPLDLDLTDTCPYGNWKSAPDFGEYL